MTINALVVDAYVTEPDTEAAQGRLAATTCFRMAGGPFWIVVVAKEAA